MIKAMSVITLQIAIVRRFATPLLQEELLETSQNLRSKLAAVSTNVKITSYSDNGLHSRSVASNTPIKVMASDNHIAREVLFI
jgi:hypothetical protein